MGYQRPHLKLVFEDPSLEGLEVTCRRLKVGDLAATATLANLPEETEARMAALDRVLTLLANHIVDWNLEDEYGEPVEPSLQNLRDQDLPLIMAVVNAWMDSAVGVRAPLSQPSADGQPSLAASIPMETLSPSPLN